MTKLDDMKQVEASSPAQLRSWLEEHYAQDESVWLITWKKHVHDRYVSREVVLDELVSVGWIDGVRRKLDEDRTMQLIGPRRTQYWAKSYKDRAARLINEGRMTDAGLASIEMSKRTGSWTFMDDVDALIVPVDLAAALEAHPQATSQFEALPPSYRRNVLRWIKLARTTATRANRIERLASSTAEGRRIPQM
ncbi:MAG: YdeI/OmpD-associated family protein [Acidimicrobiia bacterium]|nr:YdeI/OmpD-associated family protein [Acidimicrobiia bacterium]